MSCIVPPDMFLDGEGEFTTEITERTEKGNSDLPSNLCVLGGEYELPLLADPMISPLSTLSKTERHYGSPVCDRL